MGCVVYTLSRAWILGHRRLCFLCLLTFINSRTCAKLEHALIYWSTILDPAGYTTFVSPPGLQL